MLHYWLLFLGLMSPAGAADCGLQQYSSVDFATEAHRHALVRCLKGLTVSMEAQRAKSKHITVPGASNTMVRGALIRPQVLLTVASVVPLDLKADGKMPVNVLRMSQRQGLALLDVHSPRSVVRFRQDQIQAGRVYFALDAAGQMHRVAIGVKGDVGLSYYWKVPIALPLGTPIVNAHGQPVSLVAIQSGNASYLLPKESFDDFLSFRASKGVCDASDVTKKVSAEQDRFDGCFADSGMGKAESAISVTLRWWVSRDGTVRGEQTRVNGSSPLKPSFEACLIGVVNQISFAQPISGECDIEYPLIFETLPKAINK
jgi:hypothetical protein